MLWSAAFALHKIDVACKPYAMLRLKTGHRRAQTEVCMSLFSRNPNRARSLVVRFILRSIPTCAFFTLLALMAGSHPISLNDESISSFANDCETPRTSFNLGDKVCAVATGAHLGPPAQRRFEWVAPDGTIFQMDAEITSDPQNDSITLPVSGRFAQVGTWTVKTVDVSHNGYAFAQFVVQNPDAPAADLSVSMSGPAQISAGAQATFTVTLTNNGPNEAQNVKLMVAGATLSTFAFEAQTGTPFACANPPAGGSGSTTCTIETLVVNASASFVFVYQVDPNAPKGAIISDTAIVSSETNELFRPDNTATASAAISLQPCSINCPPSMIAEKQSGQCGAVVNYSLPGGSGGDCGNLFCNPAPGSFFPLGVTNVVCAANTGAPCSFTVTVEDPQPPAIKCPDDITVDETTPGFGLAVVDYPLPTLNGNCAVSSSACAPPTGSSFPIGVTTVSCEASNSAGDKAECSFTITVKSNNCSLTCPTDILLSNTPNRCGAIVNYKSPTTDGDCDKIACTPSSGSFFPVGVTVVSCVSSKGQGCSFNVIVQDTEPPAITSVSVSSISLWPPDHKMKEVTVNYEARDLCEGDIICALSVTSNEPIKDTGAGDATPDWEIIDAHRVRLRAERSDYGKGRLYTITIACTDANGNTSEKTVIVKVPRDQNEK